MMMMKVQSWLTSYLLSQMAVAHHFEVSQGTCNHPVKNYGPV